MHGLFSWLAEEAVDAAFPSAVSFTAHSIDFIDPRKGLVPYHNVMEGKSTNKTGPLKKYQDVAG